MVSADAAATMVFGFASFLGTLGMVVTGFGFALIFLSAFSVADIARPLHCDYCDVKEAVFLQAISLASLFPFMLWASRKMIRSNCSFGLLLAFVPATLIGTPAGNIAQGHVKPAVIQVIVGGVVLLFSCFQTLRIYKQRSEESKLIEPDGAQTNDNELEMSSNNLSSGEIGDNIEKDDTEEKKSNTRSDEEAGSTAMVSEERMEGALDIVEELAEGHSPQHPTGIKFYALGFALGFLAGFIGALVGVRSGPILIFFLYYQYPKDQIRSNMMIVTATNTYTRLLYYIIDSVQGNDGHSPAWFKPDIWYLYVVVALSGILAIPVGLWANKKVNQGAFDRIVILGLLISGTMSLFKGCVDLAT